ncbi:MAG: hypothetical protein OHK0056_29790 [Bacteriovoracaceae bacterium]
MISLEDKLSLIGINYQTPKNLVAISPEDVLIDLANDPDLLSDKKNLILFITWISHHYKLIHVERLKSILIDSYLNPMAMSLIGGISSYAEALDHRFKVITKLISSKLPSIEESLYIDDSYLLNKRGVDPHFSRFKIQLAKLEIENQRKLKPISQMIKDSPWIKNRILFGSNLRADIATIRELSLANTAYAASKIAKCSPNAAKRNWDDLELVNF